jgi:4-amino-4-deoxy-L-arabinose transferase-like glycosyltransferase
MELKRKRAVLVILVLSMALAFLGQYYFANKRPFLWDGILLYLVAMLFFGWAVGQVEGKRERGEVRPRSLFWQEVWQALRCSRVRLGLLTIGTLLVVYVALAAGARPINRPFGDLFALWAIGIVCAIVAFIGWANLPTRLVQIGRTLLRHSPEATLVLILAVATFLVRFIDLSNIPYVLSGDEASMGLEAVGFIDGRSNNPFATGWLSHPTLFFLIQSVFLRLFGVNTAALRLPSALCSGAIAIFLYLMARRFYGRRVAILAVTFFAAYHYAIHFGRLAINNIWDPFFAVSVFYFIVRGLEEKRLGHLAIAGVLLGLSLYFYMGARLISFILLAYLAYWALSQRDFVRRNLVYLLIVGVIALLAALPLLAFFRTHTQDMMARWSWLGIFPSGWVKGQVQATGRSTFSIVFDQFLKAALAYNYYPDPTFWYHPGIPLLHFLPSLLFIFGMAYAVSQWRKRQYFLLVVWYLLVVIFGGMLLENPPTSPRLVLSIPPVVICVALGMIKIADYIRLALNRPRFIATAISLALLVAISYQSAYFYFAQYTPAHEFAGQNTEVGDRVGRYLHALGPSYRCYFFGAPRVYYNFATIPFLARGTVGTDIPQPLKSELYLNADTPATFIFLPERRGELDVVRRKFPTGLLREFRDHNGQILFVAYEVES